MKNFLLKLSFVVVLAALAFVGWRNHLLRQQVAAAPAPGPATAAVAAPATPPPEALTTLLPRIEQQTSKLRGLPFQKPVTYKKIGRAELKEFLKKKMHEQYSPAELHDYGRTLATIGLLPAGTDLLEAILGLYDEQVAAFYVPEERALYTFADMTFAGNLDKVTLAHELTHALQDQTYDLTTFPLKVKDNDDLALASAALIEGDATLLMAQFYGEYLDPSTMISDMLRSVMGQKTAKFQAAPQYFREMLVFPYQEGLTFATAIFEAGGLDALHKAFQNPPTSTAQILHPEQFLNNRRDPVKVEIPAATDAGWRLIGNNVLGEFGIRCLFAQHTNLIEANRVAAGWDGDRFHVYEQATNGPARLVWHTAWINASEADEFAASYRRLAAKRNVQAEVTVTGATVQIRQTQ